MTPSGQLNIAHGITNFDMVISVTGSVTFVNYPAQSIPIIQVDGSGGGSTVGGGIHSVTATNIYVRLRQDYGKIQKGILILEYTKTE